MPGTAAASATATATTSQSTSESETASILSPSSTITDASAASYLLGPLTTAFTAPTQCSQAYWVSDSAEFYDPTLGQTCGTFDGTISYTQYDNCLPPVTKSELVASLIGSSSVLSTSYDYTGYYSPGISCPAGYTTACAAQAGSNGIQSALSNYQSFGFMYTAIAEETAVGCCPTGYQCVNLASTQWCQQVVATTTQPMITCVNVTNHVSVSTTRLTLPTVFVASSTDTFDSTTITSTYNFTTLSMLATMVQLKFQVTDLPSTSSSSSSTSTRTISSQPTTSTSSSSSGSNNHTTTIAVAVVVPVVAVLIAAGLAWLWYRRRAKKRLSPSYQAAAQSAEPAEMDQSPAPANPLYRGSAVPTEISGDPARFEMAGADPAAHEMAGTDPSTVAHEMYAGDEIPRYRDEEGNVSSK